jgi:hypothetical protein
MFEENQDFLKEAAQRGRRGARKVKKGRVVAHAGCRGEEPR